MTTTPERRKAAREDIARALQSRNHAYAIHYVGGGFTTPGARVTAIAARNLGTGVTESFEIEPHLRAWGINPVQATEGDLDRAERRMLDSFYAFVRQHPGYVWLHWNMRNSTFGFLALDNRQRALGGRRVQIPEGQRVDLAARLIDIYGDSYADPLNRLKSVAMKNGLALAHLVDGPDQAGAIEKRDFAAATRSLHNRIDVMYALATKAHEQTLKTQAPFADRVAATGGLIKWAKEHPVVTAFAIASPVLGAVVGTMKLWSTLMN